MDVLIILLNFAGTAEVKYTPDGIKVVTLKNINFSSQNLSCGVEATLSLKDKGVEGKLQVRVGFGLLTMFFN